MGREGFTLLELLVVIIVLAILVTLGVQKYQYAIERTRTGEARQILGQLYKAQRAYYLQTEAYGVASYAKSGGNPGAIPNSLGIAAPGTCQPSHYFRYLLNDNGYFFVAWRCTAAETGKYPPINSAYRIRIYFNGTDDGMLIADEYK